MKISTRDWINAEGYTALGNAAAHPGLWFDRYLRQQLTREERTPESGSPTTAHVGHEALKRQPAVYMPAYERWKKTLAEMGARLGVAKTDYRLAAGHGNENPIETGISLHHTYGVPYIPGSSLKGVAAAYASSRLSALWQPGSNAYKTLFGTTAEAGYVTFLDALPIPGTWKLLPDVITVHHPDYYQSGDKPPADWDSPTPISFLSATGEFLIAVLPSNGAEAWADVGYKLLIMALAEMGVGGKTSSGYGRMVAVKA